MKARSAWSCPSRLPKMCIRDRLEREPKRKGICDKAIAAAEQQARDIIAQYRAR